MSYNSRILYGMSLIVFSIANSSLFAATAGFDVLVTDADSGIPIEGVEVVGWFGNDNGWRAWTESAPESLDSVQVTTSCLQLRRTTSCASVFEKGGLR